MTGPALQTWAQLKDSRHRILEGTESAPLLVERRGVEVTLWRLRSGRGREAVFEMVTR